MSEYEGRLKEVLPRSQAATYIPERLDHLGIVAGVCQEIGLAAYLVALDTSYHAQVSVGTATVAMMLNGLGFSNRCLLCMVLRPCHLQFPYRIPTV